MTRVAIIGNAGGGKSVLARFISERLDLPLHVIDDMQWQPGWRPAPQNAIARQHAQWVASPRWVIDGWGPMHLIRQRFAAADTIVFVDLPLWRHYWWAMKRHCKAVVGLRAGWPPPGCSIRGTWLPLVRLMHRIHHEIRPALLTEIRSAPAEIIHVRSTRELRRFRARVSAA